MIKKSFKTLFSGRRRSVTRKSGFNVNKKFQGTRLKFEEGYGIDLEKNEIIEVTFKINNNKNNWISYGLYFNPSKPVDINIINNNYSKKTLTNYGIHCWSKVGSIWKSDKNNIVKLTFKTEEKNTIYFFDYNCGIVDYKYLDINNELWTKRSSDLDLRTEIYNRICSNLFTFSPEINFLKDKGEVSFSKNINKKKIVIDVIDTYQ
mgnify:FL=1